MSIEKSDQKFPTVTTELSEEDLGGATGGSAIDYLLKIDGANRPTIGTRTRSILKAIFGSLRLAQKWASDMPARLNLFGLPQTYRILAICGASNSRDAA
jgi:hypothetical protein